VLWRFPGDELKEAMALVLRQPAARQAYRRRAAIVEPRFAAICQRLGLRRFRRFGLAGARLEFALYCVAHNLQHGLRLLARLSGLFLAFFTARRASCRPRAALPPHVEVFVTIYRAAIRRVLAAS
jgi:hypothetical protein